MNVSKTFPQSVRSTIANFYWGWVTWSADLVTWRGVTSGWDFCKVCGNYEQLCKRKTVVRRRCCNIDKKKLRWHPNAPPPPGTADKSILCSRSALEFCFEPWLEKPGAGGGGAGRDLPLRAPSIPFPGWDPGGPIYNENGPFLLLLDCFSPFAIVV